jgi:hypothetical protein
MPYRLSAFGTTDLPTLNNQGEIGPAPAVPANIALPFGGSFDAWGSDRAAKQMPYEVTWHYLLDDTTATGLRTTFDALMGLGQAGR